MANIGYGYINTVNMDTGTVTIIQPDKRDNITGEMPFFSGFGEYKQPEIGMLVVYIKWGNTSKDGVVLGGLWSAGNPPPKYQFYKDTGNGTSISEEKGKLFLKDNGGSICVADMIKKLEDCQKRIEKLEQRD